MLLFPQIYDGFNSSFPFPFTTVEATYCCHYNQIIKADKPAQNYPIRSHCSIQNEGIWRLVIEL